MKILLAANHYPPEFLGGTERVVQALAGGLHAVGDQVSVVCSTEQAARVDADEDTNGAVQVHRIPHGANETYGLRVPRPTWAAAFDRLLAEQRPEVLHLHHWSHLTDTMLQTARRHGVATVATLHDMWTHCPRFFRAPPEGIECPLGSERQPCVGCANLEYRTNQGHIQDLLVDRDRNLRMELEAAAVITAPSVSCAASFRRHTGLAMDVEVVPHGLLQEVVSSHAPAQGKLRVGNFGNQGTQKGTLVLIEALAGLPVELHLAGGFPDPATESQALALAAERQVALTMHGRYDDADHPARRLDLAVFFSQCEETYGLVVEEALAHGVPVLVSNRGALPERVAGGGGMVVQDANELRQALTRLVGDQAAIRALRQAIPSGFPTIHTAVETYRSLYRRARNVLAK